MAISGRFIDEHLHDIRKHWAFFSLWGVLLMLLGVAAISAITFTTYVSVMVIGFFILFSGCILFLDTFTFWRGKRHGFVLHLLASVLYIAAGGLLISNPVAGSVTITFLLGLLYVMLGIFRLVSVFSTRLPQWGWGMFNGLVTLAIGVLILLSWPASSVFVLGLFIGIDIFFLGLAYTMMAVGARSV